LPCIFGFSALFYHAVNGKFVSQAFKNDSCNKRSDYFTGSCVRLQNGVAECYIQTVVYWARTMLFYATINLKEEADIQLRDYFHVNTQFAFGTFYLILNLICLLCIGYHNLMFKNLASASKCLGMYFICSASSLTGWEETPKMVTLIMER